jgi:MFS family permease
MDTSEPVRRKRQRLPAIHRYFQLYLFALFVNDVYVFSLIYAFLPSYLLDEGYNTTDLSNAFGADGISNTLGLLVLLYINGIPRVIATSLNTKFLLIVVSTAVCALGSALLTAMPYSYPMLIASKALQGLASSVYFAYSFILTNKLYPLEYQAQTAAVVTAGACKQCWVGAGATAPHRGGVGWGGVGRAEKWYPAWCACHWADHACTTQSKSACRPSRVGKKPTTTSRTGSEVRKGLGM